MMSSAWSQGTSFSRSVRLPVTVSLVMMFRPVKSAITLQDRAHFDVLEVERQLLAACSGRAAPARVGSR